MKKLHAADAARRGYTHAIVRTVDTDVVVIAVANSNTFSYPSFGLSLMLANTRNICQRTRCSVVLAIEKSHTEDLAFHAFAAGCDQTSPFAHYGRKRAWEASGALNDVMAAFQALSNAPVVDHV